MTRSRSQGHSLRGKLPHGSALPIWVCESHFGPADMPHRHLPSLLILSTDYACFVVQVWPERSPLANAMVHSDQPFASISLSVEASAASVYSVD